VQCRPGPLLRDRDTPTHFLETLCDIGAAELLLPIPWFTNDAATVQTAQGLIVLANRYKVSREATVRRFAETHASSMAALFFSWKLKPSEASAFNPEQGNLYGIDPTEEAWAARQLRLDYAIPSGPFIATGIFLPKDKSLGLEGPLRQAANGICDEGEADLDLGAARAGIASWPCHSILRQMNVAPTVKWLWPRSSNPCNSSPGGRKSPGRRRIGSFLRILRESMIPWHERLQRSRLSSLRDFAASMPTTGDTHCRPPDSRLAFSVP